MPAWVAGVTPLFMQICPGLKNHLVPPEAGLSPPGKKIWWRPWVVLWTTHGRGSQARQGVALTPLLNPLTCVGTFTKGMNFENIFINWQSWEFKRNNDLAIDFSLKYCTILKIDSTRATALNQLQFFSKLISAESS